MGIFFKFLMSLMAHMAWQRIGGKGPVPPVRLPRGKGPVNLPVIAPWQMMVAMWVFDKVWKQHGSRVKTHLSQHNHPVARRVGTLLPDVPDTQAANGSASTFNVPATHSAPTAQPATQPNPATVNKSHGTQKLPGNSKSLLSSLQGSGASS